MKLTKRFGIDKLTGRVLAKYTKHIDEMTEDEKDEHDREQNEQVQELREKMGLEPEQMDEKSATPKSGTVSNPDDRSKAPSPSKQGSKEQIKHTDKQEKKQQRVENQIGHPF